VSKYILEMKNGILVFILAFSLLSFRNIFSQTIQNDVLASAGDSFILENAEISWTMGESVIESYHAANIFVSQGFHQSSFKFLGIGEQESPAFQANIFPNPTSKFIQIDLANSDDQEDFRLIMFDMMGKVLINQSVKAKDIEKIDLGEFFQGILLLKIIRVIDGRQRAFKIIRTDF
jgi:hypothetical protein